MATRRAPPAIRCSVATRPMARLSMPMDGHEVWPAIPPTRVTGTGGFGLPSRDQPRLPPISAMAQMMPSTWRPTSPLRMPSTSSVPGSWSRVSEIA